MMLLLLFSVAMVGGLGMVALVLRNGRRAPTRRPVRATVACGFEFASAWQRPACWLAIKTRNIEAVQTALGLHNPRPCSWIEGLAGHEKLFIAPPVCGWVLVTGSGLPEPGEDVDECFKFVANLSRKLGQVQYFCASRILHHHAWVRAERGRILRAYAWAGRTVWHQGRQTSAEKELNLKCFDYWDANDHVLFRRPEDVVANTEKVPLLAERWSLDPGRLEQRLLETARGIAGEPSR